MARPFALAAIALACGSLLPACGLDTTGAEELLGGVGTDASTAFDATASDGGDGGQSTSDAPGDEAAVGADGDAGVEAASDSATDSPADVVADALNDASSDAAGDVAADSPAQDAVADATPDQAEGATCAGSLVGGYCWFASAPGGSCDTVCTAHGGCNLAGTRDFAGSGGSDGQCAQVLATLGFGSYSHQAWSNNDLGCQFAWQSWTYWSSAAPTTCAAAGPGAAAVVRMCACGP